MSNSKFKGFKWVIQDPDIRLFRESGLDEDNSPSTTSVNNETLAIDAEPITVIHPSDFAKNIGDYDAPSERDEVTIIGRSEPRNPRAESKAFSDASDPLDVDNDLGIHEFSSAKELKDSIDFHWVVAHVTPPSWKQHPKKICLEKLYDIHDRAYMQQVVLDNILNSKTYKLIFALSKARASCDAIQEREVTKDKVYAELERKCNEALQDLEKNPIVLDMRSEIETLHGQVNKLHSEYSRLILEEKKWVKYEQTLSVLYRAAVVSKVFPYVAIKFVCSDKIGLLVARLVKAAMFRGRCTAFEEVENLKEPFILEKMTGYRPSSGKEFDQAGDDLATASYPFITEATADPYATMEQLLSKKPRSLPTKPAPSYSKPSSSKAPIN
ncbi:hypothetical protein Tco_0446263 [Tanacetum coccineum]